MGVQRLVGPELTGNAVVKAMEAVKEVQVTTVRQYVVSQGVRGLERREVGAWGGVALRQCA